MALFRNPRNLPENCRMIREDDGGTFVLGIQDPGTESLRLALECPDYKNPRNPREARAVARVCQFGKFQTPIGVVTMLNG